MERRQIKGVLCRGFSTGRPTRMHVQLMHFKSSGTRWVLMFPSRKAPECERHCLHVQIVTASLLANIELRGMTCQTAASHMALIRSNAIPHESGRFRELRARTINSRPECSVVIGDEKISQSCSRLHVLLPARLVPIKDIVSTLSFS